MDEVRRLLVLRPEDQLEAAGQIARSKGWAPVLVSAVKILPSERWDIADAALRNGQHDWIFFTSVNGVAIFVEHLRATGATIPSKVAAVGPGTERSLLERDIRVDWVPSTFTTRALAETFPYSGASVITVRAARAPTELEEILRSRGCEVTRIDAYTSAPINAEAIRRSLDGGLDAVLLSSASIAESFAAAAGIPLGNIIIGSIGPATSEACRRLGLRVDIEANEHTISGLIDAIGEHLGAKGLSARDS